MKRSVERKWATLALASLLIAKGGRHAMADETVGSTSNLYRSVSPSVVTITVSARDGKPVASGSGVIVSSTGQILTNYHVVSGGTFFDVKIPGNPNVLPARALKCAPSKDLAMLAVTSDRPLRPARIAKQRPSVGSRVVAVGSPLSLEGSITDGVVSQFRSDAGIQLIQTTAPISPGSSGGGLFTLGGELAGVTTMTLKSGQALNFAVAVAEASYLIPCSEFPAMPSEESEPVTPTATPTPPRPDCKEGLGVKYMNISSVPGYIETSLRLTGVISNQGCAAAEGVKLRVEVFEKETHEFIVSHTFTLTRASFATGELLDVNEMLALPYGTGGKTLSVEYSVRDLASPF